jgi:hypothetical protein
MNIRIFKKEDYDTISKWWDQYEDWEPAPLNMLLYGTGFVAEDKKDLLAAVWCFDTKTPLHIMEWTVGNPNIEWKKRAEAVDKVIDAGIKECKESGASVILTMTKHPRLIERLNNKEFQVTDKNMTHLIRRV